MVKVRPEDVIHTTGTDHFIRRHPPATDLTVPLEETTLRDPIAEIVSYFPRRSGGHVAQRRSD